MGERPGTLYPLMIIVMMACAFRDVAKDFWYSELTGDYFELFSLASLHGSGLIDPLRLATSLSFCPKPKLESLKDPYLLL